MNDACKPHVAGQATRKGQDGVAGAGGEPAFQLCCSCCPAPPRPAPQLLEASSRQAAPESRAVSRALTGDPAQQGQQDVDEHPRVAAVLLDEHPAPAGRRYLVRKEWLVRKMAREVESWEARQAILHCTSTCAGPTQHHSGPLTRGAAGRRRPQTGRCHAPGRAWLLAGLGRVGGRGGLRGGQRAVAGGPAAPLRAASPHGCCLVGASTAPRSARLTGRKTGGATRRKLLVLPSQGSELGRWGRVLLLLR